MTDQLIKGQDRRRAVRVEDRILFFFKKLPPARFEEICADFKKGISIYNQEDFPDIQMRTGIRRVLLKFQERDQEIIDFLESLDAKITALLRGNKAGSNEISFDSLKCHEISMSGLGLSFMTSQQVAVGDILEFHIVLLPEYIYVYCLGKVVGCGKMPGREDNMQRISCEFAIIMDDDREKLIGHNFKQQALALKNKRLALGNRK